MRKNGRDSGEDDTRDCKLLTIVDTAQESDQSRGRKHESESSGRREEIIDAACGVCGEQNHRRSQCHKDASLPHICPHAPRTQNKDEGARAKSESDSA